MERRAYSELYLSDAMDNLACCFDYAINTCKINPDSFMFMLNNSSLVSLFCSGDPCQISGQSGIEFARKIIEECWGKEYTLEYKGSINKTKEYWCGYYLAYYQWYKDRPFKELFKRLNLSEIINMYPVFHEMDIKRFIEEVDRRYYAKNMASNLKKMREYANISQSELARRASVNIRSIQMYEQKINDIDKAQINTLYRLSRALSCDINDILEDISQS